MRLSVRLLIEGRHRELVVREAVDGLAIEKAKISQPDLILLDLAMPRLNGAEAATVLKNAMPEIPVIPIYDVFRPGRRFSVRSYRR